MKRPHPWLLTLLFLSGLLVIVVVAVGLLVMWMEGGESFKGGERVAVVRLEGAVLDPRPVLEALERHGKDTRVRAIVLRVDTPGGAVGPTQEIFQAVRRWNQSKKVVASLGSMATSGGFYVACGAERILANPGTITGSIGVVVHFANLERLLDKLGIQGEVIRSGAHKDMGSPHRPLTSEEKALLQGVVDDVHGQFVEAVAEARNLPNEQVRSLADGRIFSGRQAHALGLVDDLGGLQEAIKAAALLVGISGEPRVMDEVKERTSLLDLLLGKTLGKVVPSADPRMPPIGYIFHP
jgi:protease-4